MSIECGVMLVDKLHRKGAGSEGRSAVLVRVCPRVCAPEQDLRAMGAGCVPFLQCYVSGVGCGVTPGGGVGRHALPGGGRTACHGKGGVRVPPSRILLKE